MHHHSDVIARGAQRLGQDHLLIQAEIVDHRRYLELESLKALLTFDVPSL